jgi:predicted cytidylate kinase
MIITIGGNLGAGKTTLAARLAQALSYEELYIGGVMREMAAEQRLPIEEFYVRLKHNPELERSVDERQAAAMREKDNLIVRGRVAWFFAKSSPFTVFNIFLSVDPKIGAERTLQRPEYDGQAADEVMKANELRAKTEMNRYQTLYGIDDFRDPAHYDYVLDTTTLNKEEVLQNVMNAIAKK